LLTVAKTDKYQSGASDQIRKGWLELARAGGTFINDVISIYRLDCNFRKPSKMEEKLITPIYRNVAILWIRSSDESETHWLEPFSDCSAQLVAFFTSARNQKLAENKLKFNSQLETYF
jgi:hypothetical protein